MESVTIRDALRGWGQQDLANILSLLGGKVQLGKNETAPATSAEEVEAHFKWLYYSKARAKTQSVARNLAVQTVAKIRKAEATNVAVEESRPIPRYDLLLTEAAKHVKAYEGDPAIDDCETFLSQAVIIAALHKMKPSERVEFFSSTIPVKEMTQRAGIKTVHAAGPVTTLALLGAAQASGFGVYMAATTALGLVTHAVGVTLPFVAFTGLTSTIAFLIGPVGWLGAGAWGFWRMTGPRWRRIIPALLYIAATNKRLSLTADNGELDI